MTCPQCQSANIIKNGSIHNGKPKFRCKDCNRQFVQHPTNKRISQDTKDLIDRLVLEKLPLAGLVRVTGVSARWLQYYAGDKYEHTPRKIEPVEAFSKKKKKAV